MDKQDIQGKDLLRLFYFQGYYKETYYFRYLITWINPLAIDKPVNPEPIIIYFECRLPYPKDFFE